MDKLKTLADGATSVPMRLQFGEFTLNVISKVYSSILLGSSWYTKVITNFALFIIKQITFGSDFTEQFNKLEREYNILKEDLVVVVFKGLGLSLRYPGYRVIFLLL